MKRSNPEDKIILAIDGLDINQAKSLLEKCPKIKWVKVGLELFIREGPGVIEVVKELTKSFKVQSYEIVERVTSLQLELKDKTKELIKVKNELALAKALSLASYAKSVGKSKLLIRRLDGVEGSGLQSAASSLIDHLGEYSAVV